MTLTEFEGAILATELDFHQDRAGYYHVEHVRLVHNRDGHGFIIAPPGHRHPITTPRALTTALLDLLRPGACQCFIDK